MYSVGSLADLISGSDTPNKPKVELQEFKGTPLKTKNTPKKVKTPKITADEIKPKISSNGVSPKPKGRKSMKKEFSPKEKTFSPKGKAFSPKGKAFSPKGKAFSPKGKAFSPKGKAFTPKLKEFTPKVKEFTPKVKEFTPKVKEFTPKVKEFSSKVKESSPNETSKKNSRKRKAERGDDNESKKSLITVLEPNETESTENTNIKKSIGINATNAIKRMKHKEKVKKANPEQDSRTIFVGSVPLTTKKPEVIKFFGEFGKIQSVRFRSAPRANLKISKKTAFITKHFHPKTSTQNCYVVFVEAESAQKALAQNGQLFKSQHIRVDLVTKKTEHNQKQAIFVGNMPFDSKDEDLWELFGQCGIVESVRLIRDPRTGMGKGYGYVNFENSDAVELALQMSDAKLLDRPLRIKRSVTNENQSKKINEKGEKIRKVPRKQKPLKNKKSKLNNTEENEATKEDVKVSEPTQNVKGPTNKNEKYQGVKFTDKKKNKKADKSVLQKKKMMKILAPKKKKEMA